MTGHYKKVFNELEDKINELLFEQDNFLTSYEKVIEIILQKATKLKEYVLKTGFKSTQDDQLFVRGKYDIKLNLDTVYFETDHSFSTIGDYKAAKILANDLIQVYLEDQLNNRQYRKESGKSPLSWTGNKTALTELIYSLYAQGIFNNGNADIKLIAKTFESTFNVDLGDFYHTFMELKARKINRTKFLDSLCEALIKKMDEQDER